MNDAIRHLEFEVELQPGEKLALPPALRGQRGGWALADRGGISSEYRRFRART